MSRGNLLERKTRPSLTLGDSGATTNRCREVEGSELIPHNMTCLLSRSAALVTVPAELLVKVLKAVVSLGMLASAATVLLASAPDGKRKPTGEEI